MSEKIAQFIEDLNHPKAEIRLASLKELMKLVEAGEIEKPKRGKDVNNHIHTSYSFSPYSPAKALWMAYRAGLTTAGIMDHDSISGAWEFIEAGKILNMATTIGVECRVNFAGTPLEGRRINNPDQKTIAYVALHGIPHTQIDRVKEIFAPYSQERNKRNRQMVDRLNGLLKDFSLKLSFESDVYPISMAGEGGSITERHILFALSQKLIECYGKGKGLVDFLKNGLSLPISAKNEKFLLDEENPFYPYDLLGALKSDMVERFYIDASAECPDVREIVEFSNEIGAILAYAYLGDVVDSVTGDKKDQKFEDDYLDLLFEVIHSLGFHAVTYMPSRNTKTQLKRVQALCDKYGFMEISGEDINSPRQPFVCQALREEEFNHLVCTTWALIGHEKAATKDLSDGMFSKEMRLRFPDIKERILYFSEIGKKS